jgi:hypothetical protein
MAESEKEITMKRLLLLGVVLLLFVACNSTNDPIFGRKPLPPQRVHIMLSDSSELMQDAASWTYDASGLKIIYRSTNGTTLTTHFPAWRVLWVTAGNVPATPAK